MCSNYGVTFHRSNPFSFSFIPSIQSDPLLSSLSFRPIPGTGSAFRPLKSSFSDTISLSPDRPVSFYDLLGISETGTQLEIKQAYKKLARKYHPDVSPPDRVHEYTERFIRVQEAYETLSDPARRALYDDDMAKGLHLAFSARGRNKLDDKWKRKVNGIAVGNLNYQSWKEEVCTRTRVIIFRGGNEFAGKGISHHLEFDSR